MNINPLSFLICLFLLGSCVKKTPLELKGEPIEGAQYLGESVWLSVPEGFKEAKSFDGFAVRGNKASISLQIDRTSLNNVRRSYDKDRLSKRRTYLKELRPVSFAEVDSGLYAVVEDKRKNTKRFTLSIKRDDLIYSIKAFTFLPLVDKYQDEIEHALFSTYFGPEKIQEEKFKMAKVESLTHYLMSRDGMFPTNSIDQAVLDIKTLDTNSSEKERDWQRNFLMNSLKEASDGEVEDLYSERLSNGYFTSGFIKNDDTNLYGAFLTNPSSNDLLIICKSNDPASLVEFEEFIRYSLLTSTVGSL